MDYSLELELNSSKELPFGSK